MMTHAMQLSDIEIHHSKKCGENDKAMYEALLADSPYDLPILKKLHGICVKTNMPADILPYIEKALSAAPSDVGLLRFASDCCRNLKQFDKGRAIVKKAIHADRTSLANSFRSLALIEKEGKNLKRAEQWFRKSLEIMPKKNKSFFHLCDLLHARKRFTEERALLRDNQNSYGGSILYWQRLVEACVALKDYQSAREAYQKACLMPKCPPRVYFDYGRLELQCRNFAEAKRLFASLLRLPNPPVSQYLHLHELYAGLDGDPYERIWHDLFHYAGAMVFKNCSVSFRDYSSPFRNQRDGCRVTPGNVGNAGNTIYFLGSSRIAGVRNDDESTIPAFLQKMLNACSANVNVVNSGASAQPTENDYLKFERLPLKKGDCVIVELRVARCKHGADVHEKVKSRLCYVYAMADICLERGVRFIPVWLPCICDVAMPSEREKLFIASDKANLVLGRGAMFHAAAFDDFRTALSGFEFHSFREITNRPHNHGEVYFDASHFNHRINKAIAERLFGILEKEAPRTPRSAALPVGNRRQAHDDVVRWLGSVARDKYRKKKDLRNWIASVKCDRFPDTGKIGAIVMNCNPFTLGHLYLVEQALKEADGLYVFVLQEDKSFFPFEDRIRLVREGTKAFGDKISVHPSGKFVISSMSFPGYFSKEEAVKPADSTTDVLIFGSVIAPELNIRHRFVGEEPNCLVTDSYNETMQFLLPSLGVDLRIIPRKEKDGQVISASTVRSALKEKDWEKIRRIVPPSTYDYLVEFSRKSGQPPPDSLKIVSPRVAMG